MHRSEKDMWFAGSKSIHYQFYANVCDITSEPDSTHFAVSEHASSCPPPETAIAASFLNEEISTILGDLSTKLTCTLCRNLNQIVLKEHSSIWTGGLPECNHPSKLR